MLEVKRPVDIKFPINSPFGKVREIIINGKKEVTSPHQGIDFKCPVGTPVYAVAEGKIIRVGYQDENNPKIGLGLRVMQQFKYQDEYYIVCYGHNSEIVVREGEYVLAGEKIALSGMTGRAEGPHVHVQFRKLNTGDWIDAKFI
mgnify:FL=1